MFPFRTNAKLLATALMVASHSAEEAEAREECKRLGVDPDEVCADGGVEAWMVVLKDMRNAQPPVVVPPKATPRKQ